jgi:hypothetical protein
MTPVQRFARAVTEARRVFDTGRNYTAWLAFYEAKQAAYSALLTASPQIREIEDFWRYVQETPASKWLPIIEAEVERITHSKCADCGVSLRWPEKRCAVCRKARRLRTYRQTKEHKKAVETARKCPHCGVSPLPYRGRSCKPCQRKCAAERAKAFRKRRKDAQRNGFSCDPTRGEDSTKACSRIFRHQLRAVEREGVTLAGAVEL